MLGLDPFPGRHWYVLLKNRLNNTAKTPLKVPIMYCATKITLERGVRVQNFSHEAVPGRKAHPSTLKPDRGQLYASSFLSRAEVLRNVTRLHITANVANANASVADLPPLAFKRTSPIPNRPKVQPGALKGTSKPLIPSTVNRESQNPKRCILHWLLEGKHAYTLRSPLALGYVSRRGPATSRASIFANNPHLSTTYLPTCHTRR